MGDNVILVNMKQNQPTAKQACSTEVCVCVCKYVSSGKDLNGFSLGGLVEFGHLGVDGGKPCV